MANLTGPKDVKGKPDWSLIPLDAVEFVIPAFEYGKIHYKKKNTFRNGIVHGKLIAAAIRHITLWYWRKEEFASDSKVHHLASAVANLLMVICNLKLVGCDDR